MRSARSSEAHNDAVTACVPSVEQLVVEIFVRDAGRSKSFYAQLGFEIAEDRGTFVVLTWEGHELFIDERPDLPVSTTPHANVRVMVSDVDSYWNRALGIGAEVLAPIGAREYGLRDFTVLDPDGFGIRFGSRLHPSEPHVQ
jgi:catechol 2,3-dioxygenase-like lactoylglutathione lyase family enzyme